MTSSLSSLSLLFIFSCEKFLSSLNNNRNKKYFVRWYYDRCCDRMLRHKCWVRGYYVGIVIILWMTNSPINKSNNYYYCHGMDFDPYQLNGGLIVAVAHPDYIVIATDTRLIGTTGYDILQRNHISSRLWSATTTASGTSTPINRHNRIISSHDNDGDVTDMTVKQKKDNKSLPTTTMISSDGSIRIPFHHLHPKLFSSSVKLKNPIAGKKKKRIPTIWKKRTTMTSSSSSSLSSTTTSTQADTMSLECISRWNVPYYPRDRSLDYHNDRIRPTIVSSNIPVLIGSAGCSVDCEMLKRTIRSEIRLAQHYGEMSLSSSYCITEVVTLLSQTLYSRRTFPYYSFCIVAGLGAIVSHDDTNDKHACGGQVYIYDAIGSYEQVAVACTGTGRELMQPILDRQFYSTMIPQQQELDHSNMSSTATSSTTTGSNVTTRMMIQPRSNVISSNITMHETLAILIDSYRSVSEREIGIGDQIVFYTMERIKQQYDHDDKSHHRDPTRMMVQCTLYTSPLKKH